MQSVENVMTAMRGENGQRADVEALARQLGDAAGLEVYPRSLTWSADALFFLGRRGTEKLLGVVAEALPEGFEGAQHALSAGEQAWTLLLGPTSHANAAALRTALPWTAPRVLGLQPSAGCGDRLGLATPGHLRSARKHGLAPILAQQSIREMTRTERTPEQVMDAATWGVFEEGWRDGFGADADHLKTFEDVDRCVAAGFTFFTIDPSAYVDNDADDDDLATLEAKVAALPFDVLTTTPEGLRSRYAGREFAAGAVRVRFDAETLLRAAAKYGGAVAHTARMYRHLRERMGEQPFELEMSVDETETPTSVAEHYFVAAELRRLGVAWVSLAPRFVGRMEKGVDYIGDLERFEETLAEHVAIARTLGPYKLSLHSGSDKFSIYPLFARHARELFHLKTAGTSYLEALRAVARIDPALFREILDFSSGRYEQDKATYHVSADVGKVPAAADLEDAELPGLLDQFDARQVLHVTFGSVLTTRRDDGGTRFRDRLVAALEQDEETHYDALEAHFDRHLAPFDAIG